jgi:hypothetical protein
MKGAGGTGPSPIPYTKGDFRTAAIDNHWNDPPTKVLVWFFFLGETSKYEQQEMGSASHVLSFFAGVKRLFSLCTQE